jgi:hypothetical protein
MTPPLAGHVRDALTTLLRELLDGPPDTGAFMLNQGDPGLLASLDVLSAQAASAQPGGRSSVAAHVDHLRYGFELRNRWAQGEDPWATANWGASWTRQQVTDEQWSALRTALAREARAWLKTSGEPRNWNSLDLTEAMSSTVHLAYHLGAIRQIAQGASGPKQT